MHQFSPCRPFDCLKPSRKLREPCSQALDSDLGAVEVQVRTRRRRAALILIPGAVDGRSVWVLRGGTGAEQAKLADLHSWPQLDGQRRHVGKLKRHVPG